MTWTQGDPLYRLVPDMAMLSTPRRANLYAFSLQNPLRYMDPDGRDSAQSVWNPTGGDPHCNGTTSLCNSDGNGSRSDTSKDDEDTGPEGESAFVAFFSWIGSEIKAGAVGGWHGAERAGSWFGSHAESGAKAAWSGVKSAGSAVASSAKAVGKSSWKLLALAAGAIFAAGEAEEGAASRILYFTARNLQKGFGKHGIDFGLTGNWNPSRAVDYARAINKAINSRGVLMINGTYRGTAVIHYLDPVSGLDVMADMANNYISGWKLGAEQLHSVLWTGRLF